MNGATSEWLKAHGVRATAFDGAPHVGELTGGRVLHQESCFEGFSADSGAETGPKRLRSMIRIHL